MISNFPKTTISVLLMFFFLAACSGAKGNNQPDPMALIAKGKYREARAIVQKKNSLDSKDRAIVALCLVAENPTKASATEAVAALANGVNGIGTAAAALELLDLGFKLPAPVEYDVSMYLVEVALGSVGNGPLTPAAAATLPVGAASRNLGVAALERTQLALTGTEIHIDSTRLLTIWNSCFTLFGGSFAAADDLRAWTLFRSLGNLSFTLFNTASNKDLVSALTGATISVLESNPSIAIPARCDLASPFDNLKTVVAHDRELLARLEMSVASAQGCTRGTYAPQ